jgi:5-formyltetrahydrofolate cyclo-ligase
MYEKEVLRKEIKKKINNQDQSERRKRSKIIQERLFTLREFLESKCIMLYVSKGTGEVETRPIIKKALCMGKKVLLPVTFVRGKRIKPVQIKNNKMHLIKGLYGIYEPWESKKKRPVTKKEIDLVVVPGLAFDKANNRLGRGSGYYDRFLKLLPKSTPKIGLSFRFQLLNRVPTQKNDFPLTKVLTD